MQQIAPFSMVLTGGEVVAISLIWASLVVIVMVLRK